MPSTGPPAGSMSEPPGGAADMTGKSYSKSRKRTSGFRPLRKNWKLLSIARMYRIGSTHHGLTERLPRVACRHRLSVVVFARPRATVDHASRHGSTERKWTSSVGSLFQSACVMKTGEADEPRLNTPYGQSMTALLDQCIDRQVVTHQLDNQRNNKESRRLCCSFLRAIRIN